MTFEYLLINPNQFLADSPLLSCSSRASDVGLRYTLAAKLSFIARSQVSTVTLLRSLTLTLLRDSVRPSSYRVWSILVSTLYAFSPLLQNVFGWEGFYTISGITFKVTGNENNSTLLSGEDGLKLGSVWQDGGCKGEFVSGTAISIFQTRANF